MGGRDGNRIREKSQRAGLQEEEVVRRVGRAMLRLRWQGRVGRGARGFGKSREGLSPRTVGYIHATIRVAHQRAVKKRLIPFNVARDADPPLRSEVDEKVTLSSEELAAFFRVAADTQNRFEALFIVGALAGSRPQELLGLKWPDLVLPDAPDAPGEMRLVRRVSKSSEGLKVVEGLKGSKRRKRKRRTVYLMPEAVAALKAHRRRYLEERMLRAESWEETWRENP